MTPGLVRLLVQARRSGERLSGLPDGLHPKNLAEAHAIQDGTVAALGDSVAGWKVAVAPGGEVMRGAILGSRCLASPAELAAREVPLLGVEAEVAFRFERDMPPQEEPYGKADVAASVTALVGIEVVASRFLDYAGTPLLDRTADCMSNGAFIHGTERPDWRAYDLSTLEATLSVNGQILVQERGGHAAGDPLGPAVLLVNALRTEAGVRTGQIITTGTYTGLNFVQPGAHVAVDFAGFGGAEIRFGTD